MKKVIFLVMFLPLPALCQIVENFESGTLTNWVFSNDNRWKADENSISGNFSLHHAFDNSEAGTDQAGMRVRNLHPDEDTARWSFLVRHGYDPSSSNNWAVFLMSDSEPASMVPGGGMKGFAVGVNLTGSDDTLRLLKVNGATTTNIISSRLNWQNDIGISTAVKIVAVRTPAGEWSLLVSLMNDQIIDSCKGSDNSLFGSEWFGVYYKYSSTRDRLIWIDDISIDGCFYEDVAAPVISGCKVAGPRSLEVSFSEEPSESSLQPENFSSDNENRALTVIKRSATTCIISFVNPFVNKTTNTLFINHLCDKSGNCSDNASITFNPVFAEPGDLVITEIMADPLPVVSLPPAEYIEITNRTDFDFNIKNWNLTTDTRSVLLPEFIIKQKVRLIICSEEDTAGFKQYGAVAGLKQFPALTDSHMTLALSDSSGQLIFGTEYNSSWYGSALKAGGGWSLEMIDAGFPFYDEGNWTASSSRKGGTPGKENSVSRSNPDQHFKGIINVFPDDSVLLNVKFSEYVTLMKNGSGLTISGGKKIIAFSGADLIRRSFLVKLNEPLQRGIIYRLGLAYDITDFAGNSIEKDNYDFGLPEPAVEADIIFNELLFNPFPGDPDYIEFYNNSDKIINASRLYIASVNDETGDTSSLVQLSEEGRCILPRSFYAITTDTKSIFERYPSSDPENIFLVASTPAMNDDSGHLILFNRELDKIDEVFYEAEMHYSLLQNTEGIALEKINNGSLSTERSAWHSASESSGWGTPGAKNSADIQIYQELEGVTLSSTKITPDNDGFEDVLVINMSMNENGNVITATIFSETGGLVRKLADRLLAGPETSVIWDGSADDGNLAGTGIYIILIEMYNSSGKVRRWKKVCTVAR